MGLASPLFSIMSAVIWWKINNEIIFYFDKLLCHTRTHSELWAESWEREKNHHQSWWFITFGPAPRRCRGLCFFPGLYFARLAPLPLANFCANFITIFTWHICSHFWFATAEKNRKKAAQNDFLGADAIFCHWALTFVGAALCVMRHKNTLSIKRRQ